MAVRGMRQQSRSLQSDNGRSENSSGAQTLSVPRTVSVVIPTRDRPRELSETVATLLSQTILPLEVILVDQSSSSEPRRALEAVWAKAPNAVRKTVKLIHFPPRSLSGSAEARNVGIDRASGDVILFLDDDVLLESNFIEEILRCYENGAVGGVGGVVTNYALPPFVDRVSRALFFRGPFHDPRQSVYWNANSLRDSGPVAVDRLGGGLMSFRREICRAVRFDTNFTGYCLGEDVDFSLCASRKFTLLINPKARLVHLRSPGTREAVPWRTREMQAFAYLYKKHWAGSWWNGLRYLWLHVGFFATSAVAMLRRRSFSAMAEWRAGLAARRAESSTTEAGAAAAATRREI